MRVKVRNLYLSLTALLVVVTVVIVFAFLDLNPLEMGPTAAAWVQAFGSIAAILAAIFIASGQSRREELRRAQNDVVAYEAILNIMESSADALKALDKSVGNRSERQEKESLVKAYFDVVSDIDLLALPDNRMIALVIEARTHLSLALAMMDAASSNHLDHGQRQAASIINNAHYKLIKAAADLAKIG